MDWINKFHLGHSLDLLSQMPPESVSCVVTSPPYWGLRDYGAEPAIWDGNKDCEHMWGNKLITLKHKSGETNPGKEHWFKDQGASNDRGNHFCRKCGAWRGNLGLEPTFNLYIKHLCDIFDEVKRVLRKDGTCWVVIGDTYAGGGGWTGIPDDWKESMSTNVKQRRFNHNKKNTGVLAKSLLDIPYRFSIEMTNRGWIKRNTIIWSKTNAMPQSAKDRFTVDFEYVFYFTKSRKTLFWTNERTLKCVSKQPSGIKGIENIDWEWRECSNCQGSGQIIGGALKEGTPPICIGNGAITENTKTFRVCPRCKGTGKIKYSFWRGYDYWFEQQFEGYTKPLDRWGGDVLKADNKSNWDRGTGQTAYRTRDMRPNNQGRNKRCVWTIPTKPFPEAHFAVYPEELIEIPIRAGCPEFICKKCGRARMKIYQENIISQRKAEKGKMAKNVNTYGNSSLREGIKTKDREEIGHTDCNCDAGFESGIVLDPFSGAGTTAVVALKQGKRFIGLDIKQEYLDMAIRRIAKIQPKLF